MNGDDSQRSGGPIMGSRMNMNRYASEKTGNYSPSASYNFNNTRSQGQYQGQYQPQSHNRKRTFKRPHQNFNDRLVKQNDIIIRLLKEIRDRLPQPPLSEEPPADAGGGEMYTPRQETEERSEREGPAEDTVELDPSYVEDETADGAETEKENTEGAAVKSETETE